MTRAAIINPTAGGRRESPDGDLARHIARLLKENGFETSVQVASGDQVEAMAAEAIRKGVKTLLIGGGDGTISSVAGLLAGSDLVLGVLPLGTRNHFARDIGLPLELGEAIQALAKSEPRRIDLGEVNGLPFINNSSIGAYPRAVEHREALRKKLGGSKWLAMIFATLYVFHKFPLLRVRLELEGRQISRTTPFVFVGNNEYTMNFFHFNLRNRLDSGVLCVYTANCRGVGCLLRLLCLSLLNRLEQSRNFESHVTSWLRVHPHKRFIHVSRDGEVVRLPTPLDYTIRKGALNVLIPPNARPD